MRRSLDYKLVVLALRSALLGGLVLAFAATSALATDATIGLYSDSNGYSCNFSGDQSGIVTAYVVVNPGSAGIRAVRFSAPIPPCFKGTFISESTPDIMAAIGTSQTGISISSRNCETEPFYMLQITYLMAGGTTPCCEFPLYADPVVGVLEAVDCAYNETPINSIVSHFNANASCPCGSIFPPPIAPYNPVPANYGTNISLDPVLQWSVNDPSGLGMSYDVYFGTDPAPPLVASNVLVSGPPSYIPGHLEENTIYYWRVVIRNVAGGETSGPVWLFTTGTNLPPMVSNISPADGSTTTATPTLKWFATDPEGGMLRYDVYLGTSATPPLMASNISATSFVPAKLPFETMHWWRVVARDLDGKTTSGPTWSFTTSPNPPPTVTTLTPVCGSTHLGLAQTLTWQAQEPYGESMTYDVYLGTGPFPPIVASNLSATAYAPGGLLYSTTYSWRVVAHDAGGQEASSTLCSFTTKAENEPPAAPSIPIPVDGATNIATSVNLSWQSSDPEGQALTFDVYLGKVAAPTAGATIGLYTDAIGSTCSFSGNPSGIINAYVVVKPQSVGIRGVRFSAPIPSCFGATFLYENVPGSLVSIGSSQTGISISSPSCESQPFYVLQIGYMGNGSTTPCCEYPVIADPFVGSLEAIDCVYASTPIKSALSHFNADISCPCDAPSIARIATNIKTKSFSVSNLVLDSYYQWRVIARDAGGQETAGPLWTFQTKANQPPAAPSSPSPANGAINVAASATLSWQCSDPEFQTLKYDVYFGTSNPPPLVKSNNTTKSYNPGTLSWVTTYWWRIVARDTYGALASGPTWSFTTKPANLPPNAPALVSPANAGTNLPVNTTLVWTGSDPEAQALKYDVYFGTETVPPMVARNATTPEYVPLTLAVSTTYRWRVVARDTGGLETSGPTWSFQTSSSSNLAPHAAGNPAPNDGGSTENASPLLQWYTYDPEQDPLTYDIIGFNQYGSYVFSGQTSVAQFQVGPLEKYMTYYWSVGVSDGHWHVNGPTWSFYLSGGGIAVLVSSFDATPQRDRVNVKWELSSDEEMDRFTLLRRDGAQGTPRTVAEGPAAVKGSFVDTGVEPGKTYHYELVVRATSGSEFRSPVATADMPDLQLALYQNQPNPFNPQTTIRYDLPGGTTRVRLLIVDASGRHVRTLVDETQSGGARSVVWNGRDDNGGAVASGVYFYVLDAGKERLTRKLVLLK